MTDIKIVISILCKHLNHLYNINLKAESFRLAKYNKSEGSNVKTLWKLISKIIDISPSDSIVTNVKSYFLNVLKYKSVHFYSLPEDMSYGSRELLISFAYLIANNYLNNHITDLVNRSIFNQKNRSYSSSSDIPNSKQYSFNLKQIIKNDQDFENTLHWINGQIEYNKRQCDEYREAIQKLLLKVIDPIISSLSELEILALTNEKHCKIFLEKARGVSKAVHLHTKWLSVQSSFWKWMESVIIERDKDVKGFSWKELNSYCNSL
ncbi:hypothetical protein RI129_002434 [Pyrocoelia pectoralis]|uniref:Tubulin epsilon and delta complex protein 1 domain-containing protein n=1 Tax=Pyrocoelia pectoralis TaxID=417401 RepID=A0AAN7ZM70_9COLE